MNLPTQFTLGRLVLSGLFVLVMSLRWPYAATTGLLIFIVASLTDWVDGYLARQRNQITDLGKLLDPLADKILVSAALICLIERGIAPMWMVVTIIAREFLITGLRTIAANRQLVLAAEQMGKNKTITQMIVILTSLSYLSLAELGRGHGKMAEILHLTLMPFYWLALIVTVFSGAIYFYKNRALIQQLPEEVPAPASPRADKLKVTEIAVEKKPVTIEIKEEPEKKTKSSGFPAFKEWGVIVEALGQGAQILILRKGGIAEGSEGFLVQHKKFWLFPTEYHQQLDKTKPAAAPFARPEGNGKEVELRYFAEISDVRYLSDWEKIKRLDEYHLWREEVIRERFEYAKEPGLHLLLVRVHRLSLPLWVPLKPEYEGCKSWIDLPFDYAEESTRPVFSAEEFATRRSQLLAKL